MLTADCLLIASRDIVPRRPWDHGVACSPLRRCSVKPNAAAAAVTFDDCAVGAGECYRWPL